MPTLNTEYIQEIKKLINASPYLQTIAMEVRDFGLGFSIVEINLDQRHLQANGVLHGAVFASMIDVATYWSAFCSLQEEKSSLTSVDLKVNYLKNTSKASGKLLCQGSQIKMGKSLGYAEARVLDENDELLAHGTSILKALPSVSMFLGKALPPKFLNLS